MTGGITIHIIHIETVLRWKILIESKRASHGESLAHDAMAFRGMVNIEVDSLDGKRLKFDDVSTEIIGRELQRMISERLPYKGSGISVQHGSSPLSLKQTLRQQGIVGKEVTLSYVYLPVNLYSAWSYLQGLQVPEEEFSLEGVTGIKGFNSINPLEWHLPKSLRNLTLGWDFNRSLEHVNFPSGLQSITFGVNFNQSLEETHLPNGLRTLILGEMFNQSLDRVTLPSSL
jgi:hypothetical protein